MAIPAATIAVLVQAQGVAKTNRDLASVNRNLDDTGKKGGKALGGLATSAKALGAAGLGIGLVTGLKGAVSAFEESRKVGRQTEQVIKSTGGAANVSAKQVGALATSISKKTGIDDEAIQSGSNLLLTFKNIRNETGRGRDIFNQANKAAVDLSAAGFGSIESTSKQLGKALNDPVKGMTALGRSGVTFSEDQKKAIEALMATGKEADRVKAQQMILKEVNSQVGGSAEAQATAMDKLKVTMGNLQETVGSWLAPALDKAAGFLNGLITAAMSGQGIFASVKGALEGTGSGAGFLGTAFESLKGIMQGVVDIGVALWGRFGSTITAYLSGAAQAIGAIIGGIVQVIKGMVNFIAGVLTGDWRRAWNGIKDIVGGVWNIIKGIVSGALNTLKAIASAALSALGGVFSGGWNAIRSAASSAWNAIRGVLTGIWNGIKSAASTAWNAVKDAVTGPIEAAVGAVRRAVTGLRDALGERWSDIKSAASKAGDAFASALDPAINVLKRIVGWADNVIDKVKDVIGFIGKIKIPKIRIPNPLGGAGGGNVGPGGADPGGFSGVTNAASRMGLVVTSGYRPGDDGWHGKNRARDYSNSSGPTPQMMRFAQFMMSNYGSKLLELIYTPMGTGIKNGKPVSIQGFYGAAVAADHYDHVHVAMANGGYVRRSGWALVGEKGPELAHLGGGTTVYPNGTGPATGDGGIDRLADSIDRLLESGHMNAVEALSQVISHHQGRRFGLRAQTAGNGTTALL